MTAPVPVPPVPVVAAPMAGGPSTPALVAAVGEAGGLGFLAGGYLTPDRLATDIADVRRRSGAPFGVNLFAPVPEPPGAADLVAAYAARLHPVAAGLGVALGEPRHTDDELAAKVEVVLAARPAVVSFAFGLPPAAVLGALQRAGIPVLATAGTPEEAERCAVEGVDGLVLQGWEAGAHRGGLVDPDAEQPGLLPLLRLVRRRVDLPVVAGGGVADGAGVAAVLTAGATAAMLGTAFLRCPEAGTSPAHAAALPRPGRTVVTRAFTGRSARALAGPFTDAHADAPAAYPEVHYLTAPLRAAGRARGDPSVVNLWAGQAHELARDLPAGELVATLWREARDAAAAVAGLLYGRP